MRTDAGGRRVAVSQHDLPIGALNAEPGLGVVLSNAAPAMRSARKRRPQKTVDDRA